MTDMSGEESPTPEWSDPLDHDVVGTSISSVESVSPDGPLDDHVLAPAVCDAAQCSLDGHTDFQVGVLFPISEDSRYRAVLLPRGDSVHFGIKCDGCGQENFSGERFKKVDADYDLCGVCFHAQGLTAEEAPEPEAEAETYHDEDGAVFFDYDGGGGAAAMRLPADVPAPSKEMMRRHRAAGHCPYRPWCEDCVRGACNAPAHRARDPNPIGDVPELHSDYVFVSRHER